jgi:hypothetical protein
MKKKIFKGFYNNSLDAYVPELWANEAIALLYENCIMGNLVHRDFDSSVSRFGDIVNTRQPVKFLAKRKTINDDVVVQNAEAVNVPVKLDQFVHTSFMIRDGEESYSFQDLVSIYLEPAVMSLVKHLDSILLGQYPHFLRNAYGTLNGLTSSNVRDRILGVRGIMNDNLAFMDNRNLVWNSRCETIVLADPNFTNAESVGDNGEAFKLGLIGTKFGFTHYLDQNTPDVAAGSTTAGGAINNAGGYPKGTTNITVNGITGLVGVNTWITIAGDMTPQRVVSQTPTLGNTTSMVISPGLRNPVLDNAVITRYTPGAVNNASGYPAGYSKEITVSGFSVAPRVGQLVTFGTTSTDEVYSILEATTTSILLDRPLETALVNNAAVNIGPAGGYNLAFHRNAMALVVRPLAPVRPGTGAVSAVVNANGYSMRVTMSYNGTKQGTLVTLDMLCGVKVLDTDLGAVLLG